MTEDALLQSNPFYTQLSVRLFGTCVFDPMHEAPISCKKERKKENVFALLLMETCKHSITCGISMDIVMTCKRFSDISSKRYPASFKPRVPTIGYQQL